MTDTQQEPEILGAAWAQARQSAGAAGVDVRPVSGADVAAVQDVVREAWGPQQVPQSNLLRALEHAGNVVLTAVSQGAPVGVTFGFLGWNGGLHLHSHMTAVAREVQSRGVGYALKSWQRAVCLEHGVTEMRWTYDPLIARNAYFNLVKLGAEVRGFSPDFYGAMDDEINAGDQSDRFEVSWRLSSRRVIAALARARPKPAAREATVVVPREFDSLRRSDPTAARALRLATREQFLRLFAAGLRPEWGRNGYVFEHAAHPQQRPSETVGTHG